MEESFFTSSVERSTCCLLTCLPVGVNMLWFLRREHFHNTAGFWWGREFGAWFDQNMPIRRTQLTPSTSHMISSCAQPVE